MNLEDLEIISYDEATKLLGVTRQTIHNATSRGVLTPLPRRARKPGQFIKKQVELFINKDLALRWLSSEEAVFWQELKQVATTKKTPDSVKAALALDQVEDKIEFTGALLEGTADIAIDVVEGILQAVRTEKLMPDKFVEWITEYVKLSPSFKRIMSLLGINMDNMPDDTVHAMNTKAYEVAERIQDKILGLMMRQAAYGMQKSFVQAMSPETMQQGNSNESDNQPHAQAS